MTAKNLTYNSVLACNNSFKQFFDIYENSFKCKEIKHFKTVAKGFLFSFAIESAQLLSAIWGCLSSRSFDVTDLITNTSGSLLGFLFFMILKPIIPRILNEE